MTDNDFVTSVKKLSPYASRETDIDYKLTQNIKNGLAKATNINDYINSAYVYCFPSNRMFASNINWNPSFNNFDTKNSDWFNTYKKNNGQQPFTITTAVESKQKILAEYKEIQEYGDPQPIAVISINVDTSVISNLLQEVNVNKSGYTFLIDPYSNIISNNPTQDNSVCNEIANNVSTDDSQGFFSVRINGETMFVSYYTSSYSRLKYFVVAPLNDITTVTPLMLVVIILFFINSIVMVLFSILLAYHYLFKPIQTLFHGMRKVEEGFFDLRLPTANSYEIGFINQNFNNMVQNIDKLIKENYINKLVSKEAQLKAIQNQLNEHFLYNTLDSIHWMSRTENAPISCDMIFSLATFYRLSLSSGKEFIPIRDIVEIINNYMHIQKFRMEDAFIYDVICDEGVSEIPTPKFLYQPIVENAITHGIKDLKKQGVIHISFTKNENMIQFCVQDNGNGIEEKQLQEIYRQLNSEDQGTDYVFALKTIQSQLKIHYGESSGLHIESKSGEGAKVWFNFPINYGGRLLDDQNDNC
jgi:two-component system sensor histidine kinase YesM